MPDLTGEPSRNDESTKPESSPGIDLRETTRQQLIDSIGGWQGTVITAIAPIVFVIVNATAGLKPAIFSAVGTSVALTVYRLARKQPVQQALSGLFGVVLAAIIAARTGQARGYFLLGIWQSFIYAVPFVLSIPIRRPLVGWLWEFLDPTPNLPGGPAVAWYRRKGLLRAYLIATGLASLLFLSRGAVQATLYHEKATGWLAVTRIAMGYPLFVIVGGAVYWVVRRARAPYLQAAAEVETSPAVQPLVQPVKHPLAQPLVQPLAQPLSAEDRTVDGGLGLG